MMRISARGLCTAAFHTDRLESALFRAVTELLAIATLPTSIETAAALRIPLRPCTDLHHHRAVRREQLNERRGLADCDANREVCKLALGQLLLGRHKRSRILYRREAGLRWPAADQHEAILPHTDHTKATDSLHLLLFRFEIINEEAEERVDSSSEDEVTIEIRPVQAEDVETTERFDRGGGDELVDHIDLTDGEMQIGSNF